MVGLGQLRFAREAWKHLASFQDKGHQIPEQNQNLVSVGEAGQWQEYGSLRPCHYLRMEGSPERAVSFVK